MDRLVAGAAHVSAPREASDLSGTVALVTGSSSGIGEATARRFAAAGAAVVVNSRSNPEAGERIASELGHAIHVQADIADDADVARLVATTLEAFGRLDVLVNNAGTTEVIAHQHLERADLSVWRRIFEVNVFGTWAMSVAAMDALRATRGSIVNVSSIAGADRHALDTGLGRHPRLRERGRAAAALGPARRRGRPHPRGRDVALRHRPGRRRRRRTLNRHVSTGAESMPAAKGDEGR